MSYRNGLNLTKTLRKWDDKSPLGTSWFCAFDLRVLTNPFSRLSTGLNFLSLVLPYLYSFVQVPVVRKFLTYWLLLSLSTHQFPDRFWVLDSLVDPFLYSGRPWAVDGASLITHSFFRDSSWIRCSHPTLYFLYLHTPTCSSVIEYSTIYLRSFLEFHTTKSYVTSYRMVTRPPPPPPTPPLLVYEFPLPFLSFFLL